jgi:hypothetical protein
LNGKLWAVYVLPGRQQYLTLKVGGQVVARRVFRNVNVGPSAVLTPLQHWPAQIAGPNRVRVGQQVYLHVDRWSTLCVKRDTGATRCSPSQFGGWFLVIRPAHILYLTVRVRGVTVARRVYQVLS